MPIHPNGPEELPFSGTDLTLTTKNCASTKNFPPFFCCSIMSGAALIYYYWEAMLISYLSTRVTPIPFDSIQGLLDSSYSFYAKPGSSFWDSFQFGDTTWKNVFQQKLKPFEEEYIDYMMNTEDYFAWVLEDGDRALYENFFAVM